MTPLNVTCPSPGFRVRTILIPDPHYCHVYWRCEYSATNHTQTLYVCPGEQLFDRFARGCKDPEHVTNCVTTFDLLPCISCDDVIQTTISPETTEEDSTTTSTTTTESTDDGDNMGVAGKNILHLRVPKNKPIYIIGHGTERYHYNMFLCFQNNSEKWSPKLTRKGWLIYGPHWYPKRYGNIRLHSTVKSFTPQVIIS